MWDWCGGCAARTETKERYRLARRENSWALGFVICWMDHEPIVRSLESAAMRILRPCANNEMGKKRKRADIERRRPLPGLRGKLPTRAPQSILVTYNKTKTRGKHVRPEDNPGSWVWHSDFKSLYTFEQNRSRPYQGPLSSMEDESLPLLVLWVCQRSSKVDSPTVYLKARSRRPLLKCAEMLPLVVSPSRRAVGSAKVSKELKRRRSLWSSISLRLWLLQGPPGGEESRQLMCASTAVNAQKIARSFVPRGCSTAPVGPGKSNPRSRMKPLGRPRASSESSGVA